MKKTKKILSIFLAVLMVMSSFAFSSSAAFDSDWIAITSQTQLKAIENNMAGKYYLADDIALEGSWEAIGWINGNDVEFTGTFDGNGFKISNLYYDNTNSTNVGLFAIIGETGTVRNLALSVNSIAGYAFVGPIAGTNKGTISKCRVDGCGIDMGTVWAPSDYNDYNEYGNAGGIAGVNATTGTIEECKSSLTSIEAMYYAGGITGSNFGTISGCENNSGINISYPQDWDTNDLRGYAGGIAGRSNSVIKDCVVRDALIKGSSYIGGIVGRGYSGASTDRVVVDNSDIYWWEYSAQVGYGSYGIGLNASDSSYSDNIYIDENSQMPDHSNGINYVATPEAAAAQVGGGALNLDPTVWTNENGIIELIGVTEDIPHEHVYGEGTVTKTPSCDEEGTTTYYCNCGASYDEPIAKDCDGTCGCTKGVKKCEGTCVDTCVCKQACDHPEVSYTDNGNGTHKVVCDNCNVTVDAAADHVDNDTDYYCDLCGANVCPGHVDVNGDKKCDKCGADTDAHVHDYGEGTVTKTATCDEEGVKTFTCACGDSYNKPIEKDCDGSCSCTNAVNNCGKECAENCACKKACTHPDVTYTDNGNGTHKVVCDNCNVTVDAAAAHVDVDKDYYCDLCAANVCPGHVDVNGDGKCDNCGVETDVHEHAYGEGTVTKSATCDEDGVITYTCVCGATDTITITRRCNGACGCTKGVKNCDGECAANCVCNEECDHATVAFTDNGDGTHDGVCDNCKAVVVDNEKHADSDKNNKCDKCGAELSTTDPAKPDPDHKHADKNGDGYCDGCGHKMPIIDAGCDCLCHRHGKIWKVFYKLALVVWKLFGVKRVCECGNYHFSR